MSKTSKRRPGKNYADGWDRIFGKKDAPEPEPGEREHEANHDCWCEPEIDYVDPDTGVAVYVHRSVM